MKKEERLVIFNKFGGKCAYCGSELKKGWHVDHVEPIRRNGTLKIGCDYPERHHIDNMYPACAPCNIGKHALSVEGFREQIQDTIRQLNQRINLYRHAKRFDLVTETGNKVKFYFETLNPAGET